MSRFLIALSSLILCGCWAGVDLVAQTRQLTNGSFDQWEQDQPVGWDIGVGATNGRNQPKSVVRQGEGPCLELTGDARTMAWQLVSQTVSIEGGKSYRLRFTAKTEGLKREGNQFDNCYVGLFQKHLRGQTLVQNVLPQSSDRYCESSIVFRAHASASQAQVMIFLSKTGTLSVKDVSIELLDPKDSFQILVDEMDRHYSYFDHKDVDWPALTTKYRSDLDGVDRDQFVNVITDMLAEIEDVHIWVEHRRRRISKFISRYDGNFDFKVVDQDLREVKKFGRFGLTAMSSDGMGYIRITSLSASPETVQKLAMDIRDRLFKTPGIILDIRRNGGGAESIAQQIASLFTDQTRLYGRSRFRSGAGHGEFAEGTPRYVIPAELVYTRPVVCLIGPGCVSSGEGFAMMMKALPHATLIGQPTRGASGNPQPVQLPNGIDVWFSRWMSLLPDGTPIEGDGVPPDEAIDHADGDRTYARATELLRKSAK